MENAKEIKLLLEKSGVIFPRRVPYPALNNSVGIINEFYLWHRNYYYVLNGKFPLLDAIKIYNTVSKELGIRHDGHGGLY